MKAALREKIIAYNKARAADREKAENLTSFLEALPAEIITLLQINDVCAAILKKYGFTA